MVPIEHNGCDWADLARAIDVDWVIAVVDDRLGAINQSRLLAAYLKQRKLDFALWLNECEPQDKAVRTSNLNASGTSSSEGNAASLLYSQASLESGKSTKSGKNYLSLRVHVIAD